MSDDRTVHAVTRDGWEVVRYDRASKWFVEHPVRLRRVRVSLATAVVHATGPGATTYFDRPGGKTFATAAPRALRSSTRGRTSCRATATARAAPSTLPRSRTTSLATVVTTRRRAR
jgi:hypothetical protein